MGRARRHATLRVLQNDRLVGHLSRESSGAMTFRYDPVWLDRPAAFPISLSLPLREDPWRGQPVAAVFENLLPDSDALRRRVADNIGAAGYDAYSLLAAIGRDCVGALQFVADDVDLPPDGSPVAGEPINEMAIERLLRDLARAPLGLLRDDDFRISVAGAQEKTALLRVGDQWMKPHGTTPTTHILKPQIGHLPNGIDLPSSVENEFYCLRLLQHLGLSVARAEVATFGETRALVVERFDRAWSGDRLLRLPQEDCCQALGVPPARKYQPDGGPGMVDIAALLRGSDRPADDHRTLFQAQVAFWLIAATDGHAKNFSVFLRPGGRYAMTPLYDVLTAQPSFAAGQVDRRQLRLAMSVGTNRHYRIDDIAPRHFIQTGVQAGLSRSLVRQSLDDMAARMEGALAAVEADLPDDFPPDLHAAVKAGVRSRLRLFDGWTADPGLP